MNNKIRKLAKQAGLNFGTNISGVELVYGTFEGSTISHIDSDELAKFAELIVRECASILRDSDFRLEAYERGADDNCEVGAMFGAEAIEEHFGIKE